LATETKAPLHQRAMQELKEFAILTIYLYVTLGAVVLMKTAVLHTLESRVLPKFRLRMRAGMPPFYRCPVVR
jgi:hypothetical protein